MPACLVGLCMISERSPQTQQTRVIQAERQQAAGPVIGCVPMCFLCFLDFAIPVLPEWKWTAGRASKLHGALNPVAIRRAGRCSAAPFPHPTAARHCSAQAVVVWCAIT
jgi:hypothetical protein